MHVQVDATHHEAISRGGHGLGRRRLLAGASVTALASVCRPVHAAQAIPVGALFPLSGESGQVGRDNIEAMRVTADIINGAHAPIPMRLGQGGGLDRLGGAQLRLMTGDHEGNIQKARSEAERLIRDEQVVAIIGSYQSATAAVISQVTERFGIPFISADNSSPSLHRRGLKWFFRTGPHDEVFTEAMFSFFRDVGAKTGRGVKTATLVYEDSIFGNDSSAVQRRLAQSMQLPIVADIKYRANSASLDTEVARIRDAGADVLLPSFLHRGRHPADADDEDARLSAAGDHVAGGWLPAGCVFSGRGSARRGRVQPQQLRPRRNLQPPGHCAGERPAQSPYRHGPDRQYQQGGGCPAGARGCD